MTIPFKHFGFHPLRSSRPETSAATPSAPAEEGRCVFGLVADYGRELILSYNLQGAAEARIEVLRPDGTRVAHFEAGSQARRMRLPVTLAHGMYLVMVAGGVSRFVAPLAVPA